MMQKMVFGSRRRPSRARSRVWDGNDAKKIASGAKWGYIGSQPNGQTKIPGRTKALRSREIIVAKSASRRYFAGLSKNTFLLALASLFADISSEMLYPVLPVFLTQTLKATGSIVGLVDGFAQAAQNIVQGFSGALSDKLQKRKSIALAGYLLSAVAKPLMGLSTVWQGLFGARLLDRLGAGTRSAPRDALIASSVDEKDRGRAFGIEGVGDNAGAFLGPLLAVLLLYALHLALRPVFYLALIPGLFCLLYTSDAADE